MFGARRAAAAAALTFLRRRQRRRPLSSLSLLSSPFFSLHPHSLPLCLVLVSTFAHAAAPFLSLSCRGGGGRWVASFPSSCALSFHLLLTPLLLLVSGGWWRRAAPHGGTPPPRLIAVRERTVRSAANATAPRHPPPPFLFSLFLLPLPLAATSFAGALAFLALCVKEPSPPK